MHELPAAATTASTQWAEQGPKPLSTDMSCVRLWLLSTALHSYIGLRLVPALSPWSLAQASLSTVLLISAIITPMGLTARRIRNRRLSDVVAWGGFLFLGLFSSLIVLTVLRDLIVELVAVIQLFGPKQEASTALSTVTAAIAVTLAIFMSCWGFINARRTADVVAVDVPIGGIPDALDNFTIAQISDVHVGPTIKRDYVQAIVDRVNRLNVDLVAVTGDLVDGPVAELAPHVAPLANLNSRHGTYFVTGNHEYYSGAHPWIDELRRLGMRVLMNEHLVLRHRGADLVIAGVTDFTAHFFDRSHRSDPQRALAGAPAGAALKVLLAHQPRSAAAAAEAGFDLQISGHTHGGQFFPWIFFVRFQQPFTAGLHRYDRLWIYVSRGTGYWGPPKRFGAPSEITRLRLVRAPSENNRGRR